MKFSIKTPSRLHMSLIDMNGDLGRIDGGFGMALSSPNVVVQFNSDVNDGITFQGPHSYEKHFLKLLREFCAQYKVKITNLRVIAKKTIPEHKGLGSKTQFLLAISRGLCELTRTKYNIFELTKMVQRGGTSGIGYMAFDRGKFIVDLGHTFGKKKEKEEFLPSSASPAPPAMPLMQIKIPESWRIVLISLNVEPGANNEEEVNIFQDKCPVPLSEVQAISHRVLMQVIPSVQSGDLKSLAQSIRFVNKIGFKKIELSLQHDYVNHLISHIYEKYNVPSGMSSFGPIIYAIFDCENRAQRAMEEIKEEIREGLDSPGGKVYLTSPNNEGHEIF